MPSFVEREYLNKETRQVHPDSLGEDTPNNNQTQTQNQTNLKITKKPKNIIYCHDGYLEEYSTDDEQIEERKKEEQIEKDWNSLPYDNLTMAEYRSLSYWNLAAYHFFRNSKRVQWLGYGVGSFFAELFGITAPRYSYEMREAERIRNEKLEEQKTTQQCYVGPQGQLVEGNQVEPATEIRLDNVNSNGDFTCEPKQKIGREEMRTEYQEDKL